MGKYFKEDNQRVSKALNGVDVNALAQNSIRTAQWWKIWESPLFGRMRQTSRPASQVGKEKLRMPTPNTPGEMTYVDKLGKGVIRYVGNVEAKPGIFNQLLSSITNNPVFKFILKWTTLADFEKNRPIVTQILDTAYDMPISSKKGQLVYEKIQLRDILAQMIKNNNNIVIKGQPVRALDENTYKAIIADMQRLDDHARKWDLYRSLPAQAIIGTNVIQSKIGAHSQETKKINEGMIPQGLNASLKAYAGVDLNTFKDSSVADQQSALRKITDVKIKAEIITQLKQMKYLKETK